MINAGEGMKKREPFSYTLGGDVNWCSHYGKQYRGCLKKLKIELPYDPAISRLGIYPDETIIQKETCTPMFIAALFTIPKAWRQPKYLSTDEGIKKMLYIYTVEYYSGTKKKRIKTFAATWMQLEIIILSKPKRERQIPYDIYIPHLYVESTTWHK